MADGCNHLIKSGFVHRDLTLDNLMLRLTHPNYNKTKNKNKTNNPNIAQNSILNEQKYINILNIFESQNQNNNAKKQEIMELNLNFLFEKNNEWNIDIILTDFGVSNSLKMANQSVRGSLRHYSPEAIQIQIPIKCDKNNKNDSNYIYNDKSDVYSFGNCLFEFLHNQLIFNNLNTDIAIQNILQGILPEFTVMPQMKFKTLIENCWKFNFNDRPTFETIARDLLEICECDDG